MEPTKKIYISLPITNRDYLKQRERACELAKRIEAMGMEPVNPFEIADGLDEAYKTSGENKPTWYDYMGEDVYELLQCDGILVDEDSNRSYGCSIELAVAKAMAASKNKKFNIYHTSEQWDTVKERYII